MADRDGWKESQGNPCCQINLDEANEEENDSDKRKLNENHRQSLKFNLIQKGITYFDQ